MSFSLREVLRLTSETTESQEFSPHLLRVMLSLVEEMADIATTAAARKVIDITQISPFELRTNDWHIALLQIYENLYEKELTSYKNSLWFNKGDRNLPVGKVSNSTVLYDFLSNLHIRRVNFPVNAK